jgi:hypothetical protein
VGEIISLCFRVLHEILRFFALLDPFYVSTLYNLYSEHPTLRARKGVLFRLPCWFSEQLVQSATRETIKIDNPPASTATCVPGGRGTYEIFSLFYGSSFLKNLMRSSNERCQVVFIDVSEIKIKGSGERPTRGWRLGGDLCRFMRVLLHPFGDFL